MLFLVNKNKYLLVSLLVGLLFLLPNHSVSADAASTMINFASGAITTLVGGILEIFIYVIGGLLRLAIAAVMVVAKYDRFITETAVTMGWAQVRNLANMFFVVILLVIAFATILRVDSYNVKKLLPKLVIMAILINFSKMICGIIIEINQVVMMTFLNAINDNGSGMVNLLGVQHFLDFVNDNKWNGKVGATTAVSGYLLALVFLIVSLVVVMAFVSVLLMRVIMLWVYIVLSPLAFLLSAFPQGQSYANRWWDDFTKYAVTGPVLAFFLWLAMASAQGAGSFASKDSCMGPYEMFCTDNFLQFIIGIGMLIGGLQITAQIGGTVGSAASKALGRIQKGKEVTVGYLKGRGKDVAVWSGQQTLGVMKGADRVASRVSNRVLGTDIQGGMVGTAFNKAKHAASFGWLGDRNRNKIEADKALHSFYTAEKEAGNDKDKQAKLRLKIGDKEYKREGNNFVLANKDGEAINEKGEKITNDKEKVYAQRKGWRGQNKNLSAMGGAGADMFMGRASALSMAWAAAKQATDKKISEEQAKIEASGMTTDMMKESLRDGSESGAKKMALALTLAVKEGFKTAKEVSDAKGALGSNQLLLKKFNDAVDKKFAHLNYDTSTATGKASFIKRLESGKIDEIMDKSAYESKDVLETIKQSKGDVNFNDYIKKVGKTTAHKESLKKGLLSSFSKENIVKDGAVDPMRKAMVELSGDFGEAFQDIDMDEDTEVWKMQQAMDNMLDNYSAKQLANIDTDSFNSTKMKKYFSDDEHARTFVNKLESAVNANLNYKDVDGAKRAGASKNLENVLRRHARP